MAKTRFWRPKFLLKGRGRLATKMNTTFFMGNEVLNIFSSKHFFEIINIFGKIGGKMFRGHYHF